MLDQVVCPFCGSIVYANVPDGVPSPENFDGTIPGNWMDGKKERYFLISMNHCPECGKDFYIIKSSEDTINPVKDVSGLYDLNPTFKK